MIKGRKNITAESSDYFSSPYYYSCKICIASLWGAFHTPVTGMTERSGSGSADFKTAVQSYDKNDDTTKIADFQSLFLTRFGLRVWFYTNNHTIKCWEGVFLAIWLTGLKLFCFPEIGRMKSDENTCSQDKKAWKCAKSTLLHESLCVRNVFAKQKKKQLSLWLNCLIFKVGHLGLEPRTSRLWVCCSNQLS